ncbi:unnamed protein product [Aspergillus oryzae]|nr:unnamed protein product [Aspergillus oryzae]GMF88255.1 unnamed protein product [Aspergillus oryzae]
MGEPYSPERGGFVPSFTGGAILDALSISFLADRFGRRITGSIVSDIGCALQGGVVNVAMMIDGRLIAGFSIGLLSAIAPMYCSEIATAENRGKLSDLGSSCCQGILRRPVARLWMLSKSIVTSNGDFHFPFKCSWCCYEICNLAFDRVTTMAG